MWAGVLGDKWRTGDHASCPCSLLPGPGAGSSEVSRGHGAGYVAGAARTGGGQPACRAAVGAGATGKRSGLAFEWGLVSLLGGAGLSAARQNLSVPHLADHPT